MKKINIILGLAFSVLLTLGFFIVGITGVNEKIVKIEQEFIVDSLNVVKEINLPQKIDYIIQIKYLKCNTNLAKIKLNGKELELKIIKESDEVLTQYYYLPKETVEINSNFMSITFYPKNPDSIDIRITNYINAFAGENILLLVKDSGFGEKDLLQIVYSGCSFFIFTFALWLLVVFIGVRVFNLLPGQSIYNAIIAFVYNSGIFLIISVNSLIGPFSLRIGEFYLLLFLYVSVIGINISLNIIAVFILKHLFKSFERVEISPKSSVLGWLKVWLKWFLQRFKISPKSPALDLLREWGRRLSIWEFSGEHLKDREVPAWGKKTLFWFKAMGLADKLIVVFICLLILSVSCLVVDLISCAENIATSSYFFLIAGVVMKIFGFKNEKNT